MNTISTTTQQKCTKCLLALKLQLASHGLDPEILSELIAEQIQQSNEYYNVTEQILSPTQRVRYKIKHLQAEILLSLLRRTDLGS